MRLVLRHEGDHTQIDAVAAPLDLDRERDLPDALMLGTSDLVHLAVQATDSGWQVTDLEVADQWDLPVDVSETDEIVTDLRAFLRARNEQAANELLNGRAASLFIRWVQLRDLEAGGQVLLNRDGVLDLPGNDRDASLRRFMTLLTSNLSGLSNG